jgi:carbon-monoxide dehydrogenase small subunit
VIRFKVNGQTVESSAPPTEPLLQILANDLGLNGQKYGCGKAQCGACTVLMDGRTVRSCLTFAVQADGSRLTTIEGLANGTQLHPIQEAFWEEHGLQCGFCTPGMLMAAHELLSRNPDPSDDEIRDAISGNLCRCTGYIYIVNAIRSAAAKLRAPAPASAA